MERCDELGQITDEPGRLTRTFHSPAMQRTNALVGRWMSDAGAVVREDAAFNLIGRWPSARKGAPTLLLGSHLDTVPNAGKYDGPLGVLIALAAMEVATVARLSLFTWRTTRGSLSRGPSSSTISAVSSRSSRMARIERCSRSGSASIRSRIRARTYSLRMSAAMSACSLVSSPVQLGHPSHPLMPAECSGPSSACRVEMKHEATHITSARLNSRSSAVGRSISAAPRISRG